MFQLLIFAVAVGASLAYDIHLVVAEKQGAIPHYTRHGYEYPAINLAQYGGRQRPSSPVRGFELQSFNRQPPAAPLNQNTGFQPLGPFSSEENDGYQRPEINAAFPESTGPAYQRQGFGQPGVQTSFFRRLSPSGYSARSGFLPRRLP